MTRREMAKLLAQLNNDLSPVRAHLQEYQPGDGVRWPDESESHADALDALQRAVLHIAEAQRELDDNARVLAEIDSEKTPISELSEGDVFRWHGVRMRLADVASVRCAYDGSPHLRVTYLDGDPSDPPVYRVGDAGLLPTSAKVAVVERKSERGAA